MKRIQIVQFRITTTKGEAVAFNNVEGFAVGESEFINGKSGYNDNQPCISIKTRKGYVEFNLSEVKDISFHVVDTDASSASGLVVVSNYIDDDPPINKGRDIGWSDRE